MSFQDSAVIFFIALLLFGPKKLPELARQLGKLMGEFRRASNDFRMQMEDELRVSEQAERQKQIAAIEASAPPAAADLTAGSSDVTTAAAIETTASEPIPTETIPDHTIAPDTTPPPPDRYRQDDPIAEPAAPAPLPIASSGDLHMMPPATGLPVGRTNSGVAQAFESIPQSEAPIAQSDPETAHHA